MSSQKRLSPRAEQMFALIEAHLKSGLTQKAFCEQHHLTLSTFHHWRRKYAADKRQDDACMNAQHEFIALRPLVPRERQAQWVIEFPHGVIVRLSGAIDIHLLQQLIHAAGR